MCFHSAIRYGPFGWSEPPARRLRRGPRDADGQGMTSSQRFRASASSWCFSSPRSLATSKVRALAPCHAPFAFRGQIDAELRPCRSWIPWRVTASAALWPEAECGREDRAVNAMRRRHAVPRPDPGMVSADGMSRSGRGLFPRGTIFLTNGSLDPRLWRRGDRD